MKIKRIVSAVLGSGRENVGYNLSLSDKEMSLIISFYNGFTSESEDTLRSVALGLNTLSLSITNCLDTHTKE